MKNWYVKMLMKLTPGPELIKNIGKVRPQQQNCETHKDSDAENVATKSEIFSEAKLHRQFYKNPERLSKLFSTK